MSSPRCARCRCLRAETLSAYRRGRAALLPPLAAAGGGVAVGDRHPAAGLLEREAAGAELVLEVISKGAAQSWQMENRGKTMHARKFDFGFAVDWMRKDLGLVLDEAKRNGARLPVTALVDQFYADVQQAGGNRFDTSSLITRLK